MRRYTGWTQETLAGLVGLTQADVSKMERNRWNLRDIAIIRRIADRLFIPSALLGFGTTVAGGDGRKEVIGVDRRQFGQHVAATVLGIAGAAGLDLDRLAALLPAAEPTGTRHVGATDVEFIEQLTAMFRRQDFTHGSGMIHHAAVAQLRAALPLLDAQVTPEAWPRLQLATADLALQAGYMSFECKQHDAARQLWLIALDLARDTDHPQGVDLTAYLLYDMTLQALHLDRPDEALHLVRVGQSAAVGRHPVSASTASAVASIQARAYAAQGDQAGCDRALGQATEQLSALNPAISPPWTAHLGDTGGHYLRGAAHYTLAVASRDRRAAERAVPLLHQAVDHLRPGYGRLRALYLPDFAGASALAGDLGTAVTLGHQAIDAVTAVSSPRAHDRLRTLDTVLEPLHATPGVTELRNCLATTTATA